MQLNNYDFNSYFVGLNFYVIYIFCLYKIDHFRSTLALPETVLLMCGFGSHFRIFFPFLQTQCADEVGETFGRKKRSADDDGYEDDVVEEVAMTRGFEVIAGDDETIREMLAQDGTVYPHITQKEEVILYCTHSSSIVTVLCTKAGNVIVGVTRLKLLKLFIDWRICV